MMSFIGTMDDVREGTDHGLIDGLDEHNDTASKREVKQEEAPKGLSRGFDKMKKMKELEGVVNERLRYLEGIVGALREGIHSDIQIRASDGPPIPAHKAVLATRSTIFKTMLDADECKAAPSSIVSLPELSNEELQCLLEFLYCGDLPKNKLIKHAHSMLIAADKYEITYLKKCCESQILGSLKATNALDVLELSAMCSNDILMTRSMDIIVNHMEQIVCSDEYMEFAMRNAFLAVQVTRALLKKANDERDKQTKM